MTEAFDFAGFTEMVCQVFCQELHGDRTPLAVVAATRRATALAEATLAENLADDIHPMACAAGCATCCVINVGVLFPEVLSITEFLGRRLSRFEVAKLQKEIEELYQVTRWLDEEDRLMVRRNCSFLDAAGTCSIYPVRPLLCRSVTSTDADACRGALTATVFGEQALVLMNLFQKSLMEAAYLGVARGLDSLGLDSRGARLTAAMHYCLVQPAASDAYAAGQSLPALA